MTKKLLVIIPDFLSALIEKGEITDRYYNPGDLFEEVHIMMTNHDQPDCGKLQKTVGEAKLVIHNYPEPAGFFKKTLGWRPWLMNQWAKGAIDIARQINPSLIRCHGAHLNTFLAAKIKEALGVPYVVSLHINPEEDIRKNPKREMSYKNHFVYKCQRSFERVALSNANTVICVYKWIESYAKQFGAKDVKTIYNVINCANIKPKIDYTLKGERVDCVIPGRQFIKKDPSVILKLMPEFDNLYITLVGNGPYQPMLKSLAKDLNIDERVKFIDSMPNDLLCESLKDYDFLVSINDYGGISKVELEAAFTGMPIITNILQKEGLPEVLGENVLTYDGTSRSLRECMKKMIINHGLRRSLGEKLRHSVEPLKGNLMEKQYSDIYTKLMEK